MLEDVVVEPLTGEFVLWRCLHGGPLSAKTIDRWPADDGLPYARYRRRNTPLLAKLTRIYGACAIVARDGDEIVGYLRFYPKAAWDREGAGGLCLMQDYPSGPADDFGEKDFPPLREIKDRTLVVHCLMTGSSQQKENPYQRKGLGTRLVSTLIRWAKANGWDGVEVTAFEDLPLIYKITGSAGRTFWEKLGFFLALRGPHPDLQGDNEFTRTLEAQARAAGIPPERARDRLIMRLTLA